MEEGQDASFIITIDSAPTFDFEFKASVVVEGDFTDTPTEVKSVTITAGSTEAELVIPTIDDGVDEDNGSVYIVLGGDNRLGIDRYIPDPDRQFAVVQILDNESTLPPEKMETPTVLPANGRLEVFWEEPTHYGERKIDTYLITLTRNTTSRTVSGTHGDQRHQSITSLVNGTNYAVQIQACKEGTTYCSELSDAVSATPATSGPAITGPQTASLPEEAAGTLDQYTATPSTGGTVAWRLGGNDAEFFRHAVNSDGSMTLTLKAGTNFEWPRDRNRDNIFEATVVVTDSTPSLASSVIETTVTVTDVDETPVFDPNSITKGTYVVGERIEQFCLPAPKVDEAPISYRTTDPPPGLVRFRTTCIGGTPTQAGTFTMTHTVTDVDGDEGSLSIVFTVVEAANNAPEATEIGEYYLDMGGGTKDIGLGRFFNDEDGDTLEYSATSSDVTVATTSVTGETLSLTPVGFGTTNVTATVRDRPTNDPEGLTASQTFKVTVDYLPVVTISPEGSGEVTEGQEARFTLTADPAPSGAMEVRVSLSQQGGNHLTGTIPERIGFAAGSTSETLILQTEDDSTGEEDGNIRASILHLPGDPYTPGNPRTAGITIKDNDTLTLNVEPMPLRQARVSWNLIPEVIRYELEIREQSGTWSGPIPYDSDETKRDVDLDDVLHRGLADTNFEFRIRALYQDGATTRFGDYSQTVRIVENPPHRPWGKGIRPEQRRDRRTHVDTGERCNRPYGPLPPTGQLQGIYQTGKRPLHGPEPSTPSVSQPRRMAEHARLAELRRNGTDKGPDRLH